MFRNSDACLVWNVMLTWMMDNVAVMSSECMALLLCLACVWMCDVNDAWYECLSLTLL